MEMLLDTLKWSVIVGGLALGQALLRPVFERRYSARWRYWAWLVLAVLALLAPLQWETLLPDVPTVSTPVVIGVPQVSVYVSRETGVTFRPQAPADVSSTGPDSVPAGTRTVALDEILPVVWLGGAAVFMLYHLLGIALFRQKARRWSRKPSEEAMDVYDAVWQDMELEKVPPLRISSAVGSPMLLGVLRPCLLLPSERWSEWELTFILRHELTHYRRHDLWYKLVLLAANALHWFNPLLYLMRKEAGADLELTCDGEVMAGADRETRRAYSETLLSAIHREKGVASALSTHFYGGKEVMKERFRNILTNRRRKWGVLVLALTLLAAAVSACAFGLQQTETEQRVDSEPDEASDSVVVPPASTSSAPTVPPAHDGLDMYGEQAPSQPTQGEEPEIIEPPAAGLAMEQYQAVLLEDLPFTYIDGTVRQELTTGNIKQAITEDEGITVSIPRFSVVDLDRDGEAEIVLWLRINDVNDVGSAVLHRSGSEVYGYVLFTREFNDLKTDGTFSWSNSASDNGYGTLTFSETGYTIHETDVPGDTNVTWYDFTPENIARILGDT